MFSFKWAELTSALQGLAESPAQRERVQGLVTGIQRRAEDFDRPTVLMLICSAAHLTQHEDPARVIEDAMADTNRCSAGSAGPP